MGRSRLESEECRQNRILTERLKQFCAERNPKQKHHFTRVKKLRVPTHDDIGLFIAEKFLKESYSIRCNIRARGQL